MSIDYLKSKIRNKHVSEVKKEKFSTEIKRTASPNNNQCYDVMWRESSKRSERKKNRSNKSRGRHSRAKLMRKSYLFCTFVRCTEQFDGSFAFDTCVCVIYFFPISSSLFVRSVCCEWNDKNKNRLFGFISIMSSQAGDRLIFRFSLGYRNPVFASFLTHWIVANQITRKNTSIP